MKDILLRVRARVEAGDWRNRMVTLEEVEPLDPFEDKTPGCLVQLIRQEADQQWDLGTDALARLPVSGTIVEWNDKPGRTQADVLALIDKALSA